MSVAMQPVGEFEASILSRAAEARRRLMGQPVKEPPRPKPPEDAEPVSRARLPHAKLVRPSVKPPRAPSTYRNKATADWTPERVQKMLTMWRDGHSASEIAQELGGGITRSAVCGKAWRLRNPADAALSSRARKKQPKKANKPKSHSNIITRAAAAPKAKTVVVALPVSGVSDADLVKGWLAQNGGPRKFATGDSGDTFAMKSWLWERGYEMTYVQKRLAVRRAGSTRKPQRMNRPELVAFVDKLRAAEGLEAIAR